VVAVGNLGAVRGNAKPGGKSGVVAGKTAAGPNSGCAEESYGGKKRPSRKKKARPVLKEKKLCEQGGLFGRKVVADVKRVASKKVLPERGGLWFAR